MSANKIYWYGFTRQLKELYYLLRYENFILCGWDEFLSHFTGKKFDQNQKTKVIKKYAGKLKWCKDKYLLILISNHLTQKGFLNSDESLQNHFENIPQSALNQYQKNKNNSAAKKMQSKSDCLFPATSGYRCKERLYYKARNKNPQNVILKNCGVV